MKNKILVLTVILSFGCTHRHQATECQLLVLAQMVKDLHVILDPETTPSAKKTLLDMDKILHKQEIKKFGCEKYTGEK